MSRFARLVSFLLFIALWMIAFTPDASAHHGYTAFSYTNNALTGYSQSIVDWSDWGWDCLASEVYDPIADANYCPSNGWWFGWGGVDGYLYTENNVEKFSDYEADDTLAQVDYELSPEEYGEWRAHADYSYGEDFYYSECRSYSDCDEP